MYAQMQTRRTLSDALLLNNCDYCMVQQTLRDSTLDKKIRNRMNKYLNLVNFVNTGVYQMVNQNYSFMNENTDKQSSSSQIEVQACQTQDHFIEQKQNSRLQTKNNSSSIHKNKAVQINKSQQFVENKNFTTSRYVKEKPEPQQANQMQKKKSNNKQKILNSTNKSRSRSKSFSSSHSKPFHKIELKSVKKINSKKQPQKGQPIQLSKLNDKIDKGQLIDKNTNKTKSNIVQKNESNSNLSNTNNNISKRYTISKRNTIKNEKAISNQISHIRSNSRITVSRVKNQSTSKSKLFQTNKSNSKSRYKNQQNRHPSPKKLQCSFCEKCEQKCDKCQRTQRINHSHIYTKQCCKDSKIRDVNFQLQMGNTNLIKQTVQKSSDFLKMLQMMNYQ